jgi:hypothetical protein
MKPTKGLDLTARPEDQPEGTYPFGKNGVQFDLQGAVVNEPGFTQILTDAVPLGYNVNGIIETDTTKVFIFFTDNVNSCIKLIDVKTGVVTFDFSDQLLKYKLGFKIDNYIKGQVQRNYLGELVCAFTDKATFPKFFNADKPEIAQLKDWNLFPECTYCTIAKSLEPGGFLNVGAYFFATRYYKLDGTTTSFSPVTSSISVISEDNEKVSDKSVVLNLTNMDTAYSFIEIAVISKVNGITVAKLLPKIPSIVGTQKVTYSGDGTYTDVSLEEILIPQVTYDLVHSIGQLNDALYVARVEKTKTITDMQPFANLIKVVWQSELVDLDNPPEEVKNGTKKTFKHNETYALYIRYKLANGSSTIAFTIPGIDATASQLLTSAKATTGGFTAPVFKVEDCITNFSTISKKGITGPYLNETETYPNIADFDSTSLGGEDLRGKPVRHHKLPSNKWCKENLYSTETKYGTSMLDILGIEFQNIIIPTKYSDVIVGYEILYAKRTVQNMTQYSQGLLIYGSYFSNSAGNALDPTTIYSAGHNWHLQESAAQGYRPKKDAMRFHGFDLLFNKPGIKPAFISAQHLLEGAVDTKYIAWSYPTGGLQTDSYGNTVHLVDMTANTATSVNSTSNNLQGVEKSKYLLNNTNSGDFVNQYLESCFVGKLLGTTLPLTVNANDSNQGNFGSGATVQAHIVDLGDLKSNIYENFYTQELVSAGDPINTTSAYVTSLQSKTVWGGDAFVNYYTFHTYGVMDANWASHYDDGTNIADPEMRGKRVVHRIACETVANLWTRYEIASNKYSKWFPHNPLPAFGTTINFESIYPLTYNGYTDPNQFGYTKGSEGINDFVPDDIFNPYRVYQTKFPYRVHRGGKLSRQNQRSWRTFLPLDYYECQKNMGFIEHVEGMDDRLLLHHTNALFITQDKTKLESNLLSVTLGTGDIFQFEPQEVQSAKLGYGGTQHDLACVRTPVGYVFADAKQGELYLYKGKELTLLNEGLHRFIREYLKVMGTNSFMGNGITLGWDQKYKRILATVKNIRPANKNLNVTVITSPDDIKTVSNGQLTTVNGIVNPGDIIFYYNKFLIYKGVNNITSGASSPYDCPSDVTECPTVTNLAVTPYYNPPLLHFTWSGNANLYHWELWEIDTFGNQITAASGNTSYSNTTNHFMDFDDSVIDPDTLYIFSVWAICEDGTYSYPVTIPISIATPAVIIPPGSVTNIYFKVNFPYAVANGFREHTCTTSHPGSIAAVNAAAKVEVTVNGTVLGIMTINHSPCSWNTLNNNAWTHGVNFGTGGQLGVPGNVLAATVKVRLLTLTGNNFTSPTYNAATLLTTNLTPVSAVVSGANNNIFTWTGVHIDPNTPFSNGQYYNQGIVPITFNN